MQSISIVNFSTADDAIDNLVETTFNIEFISGTDLKIDISIDPERLTLPEKTYTSDEIKNANEIDLGSFGLLLYQMLDRQLKETFKNAEFFNLSRPIFNGNTFEENLDVKLTSSFFDINDSIDSYEYINGLFDMDARINYTFNLQAEPGWNNSYLIDLGEKFDFKATNGILQGRYLKWIIKNWDSGNPNMVANLKLYKMNPTTDALTSEDIFFDLVLDSTNVKPTSLTINILANGIDLKVFDILPDFISEIDFIPADGVRLLVNNGLITWNECYLKTIKPLEENMVSTIEKSSFNQTLDLTFKWDNKTTNDTINPYEINNMDNKPALKAILKDKSVNLQICDISSRALFGLINSGAEANITREDVNFGDDFSDIGYDYNLTLYLPPKITLDGENVYTWNETNPISGEFDSENIITYETEEKDTFIEIEIKNSDLNLLSFFTGKTELTFGLRLDEVRNYNITTIPDEFILPEKISLSLLNSDAFRLCVEEGVFNEQRVNSFLNNEKDLFEFTIRKLIKGFDINAKVNREIFENSLAVWDGNISDMNAENPVKTGSYAHSTYSVPFDLAFLPPGINIPAKKFNFTGLKNQKVTYKIIFPNGISIKVNDPSNKTIVTETKNGRDYLLISIDPSESDSKIEVSCKMTPSILFILGIFLPCIVSFVIAILLIIVIYILRKKRKKSKGFTVEDTTGYEEEDYYVPPPPGSD
jgi:hypothetical protein